jgi:phosphatidate cytidylyltransferase
MLRTRILSAIAMAVVLITALLSLGPMGWSLFSLAIVSVAAWEWGGLARLQPPAKWVVAIGCAAICWVMASWTGLNLGHPMTKPVVVIYSCAVVFWCGIAPLWLAMNPAHPNRAVLLVSGVLVLVPAYIALLDLRDRGIEVFLLIGAIVWIADVAAYFSGRRFGRRKLAPSISPGKSWEGVMGGLIAVGLYGLAMSGVLRGLIEAATPTVALVAAALILGGFSVVGDLFESSLKRQAGVKDSGYILPGHGGILDRIDALLPVMPLAALGALWISGAR